MKLSKFPNPVMIIYTYVCKKHTVGRRRSLVRPAIRKSRPPRKVSTTLFHWGEKKSKNNSHLWMVKRNDLSNYIPCLLIINFMLLKESDRFQAPSRQSICLKIFLMSVLVINWSFSFINRKFPCFLIYKGNLDFIKESAHFRPISVDFCSEIYF